MIVKLRKYKISNKYTINEIIKIYISELDERQKFMVSEVILSLAGKI